MTVTVLACWMSPCQTWTTKNILRRGAIVYTSHAMPADLHQLHTCPAVREHRYFMVLACFCAVVAVTTCSAGATESSFAVMQSLLLRCTSR